MRIAIGAMLLTRLIRSRKEKSDNLVVKYVLPSDRAGANGLCAFQLGGSITWPRLNLWSLGRITRHEFIRTTALERLERFE